MMNDVQMINENLDLMREQIKDIVQVMRDLVEAVKENNDFNSKILLLLAEQKDATK